jgi:hypothetical protein
MYVFLDMWECLPRRYVTGSCCGGRLLGCTPQQERPGRRNKQAATGGGIATVPDAMVVQVCAPSDGPVVVPVAVPIVVVAFVVVVVVAGVDRRRGGGLGGGIGLGGGLHRRRRRRPVATTVVFSTGARVHCRTGRVITSSKREALVEAGGVGHDRQLG